MVQNVPNPSLERTVDPAMRQETNSRETALIDQYLEPGNSLRVPTHTTLEHQPWHRTMAYLLAAGRNRLEIAKILGIDPVTVSQAMRQPWFQKELKEITDDSGKDMVKSFLEGEVLPSLEVLREIRDDPNVRSATRVTASNSILDRFLGKPTVHVESSTNLNIHNAAATAEQVQTELERVTKELNDRGVGLINGRS